MHRRYHGINTNIPNLQDGFEPGRALLLYEAIESWKDFIRGSKKTFKWTELSAISILYKLCELILVNIYLRNVFVGSGAPKEIRHEAKSLSFFFLGHGSEVARGPFLEQRA